MGKRPNFINRINKPLNSSNFVSILGLLFWLFLFFSIAIIFIIYCNDKPALLGSSQGFNNLFEIFKFPLYLLAASLAAITLRITLIRVTQTDKQLEAIYKPELYTDKGDLFVKIVKKGQFYSFAFTNIEQNIETPPKLEVYNVGFAAATQIKYNFKYDINSAVEILNEENIKNEFSFDLFPGKLEISSSIRNFKPVTHFIDVQNTQRNYNFLLTTSERNLPLKIELPVYYCDVYTLFLYSKLNAIITDKTIRLSKEQINLSVKDVMFPKLELNISYKDLASREYQKTFNIELVAKFFNLPFFNGEIRIIESKFLIESEDVTSRY